MTIDGLAGCIDRLATRFSAFPTEGEILRARADFDRRRGQIYDDDELYKTHMALFLEWFVVERALQADGRPPVRHALAQGDVPEEDQALLTALAQSQRGLFQVIQPLSDGVLLADLILGGRWRADLEPPVTGLDPGDIFEGRLVPWQGRVRFGPVLFFHPREAQKHIRRLLEEVAERGGVSMDIIDDFAEMRLRHSRFRNIAVERIYTWTNRNAR